MPPFKGGIFRTFILQKRWAMRYIIAATDFSKTSANAVNYAAALAMQQQAELVLLHSFAFPVMMSDMPVPVSLIDDTQKDAEEKLDEFVASLSASHPGLKITSDVEYGSLAESVEKYADTHGAPWLVVMGNSNTHEDSAWFFSTLKEVAQRLKSPVLAVPDEAAYRKPKKICYGIDLAHDTSNSAVEQLLLMTQDMATELHVFNAQEGTFDREHIPEVSEEVKKALEDANPYYHFRYNVNIDEAMREFCESISADWLAIQPGKYSFFEGLFHKSHTKAMAGMLHIPLLILH